MGAVLILAGDPAETALLADLVRNVGAETVVMASAGEAERALAARSFDLVLADLRGDIAPIERISTAAAGTALIVEIGAGAIDLAVALAGPGAALLVDPEPAERVAALAAALTLDGGGLHEQRAAYGLRELSVEAARIARALAALAEDAPPEHPVVPPAATIAIGAQAVRAMIRGRRLRERFFAAEIFADPAWDILLDLYAARLEGTDVAVSSLCIAACVPPTTALRWIAALTRQGLLVRVADPADRRRIFIALREDAAARMAGYFAALSN